MKLKLVYVSLLLALQAASAIAQSDILNTQDSLAKNITNLETENVIAHFANKPVDPEIKRKALLMAQKQLAEKKNIAQSFFKSKADIWSVLTGGLITYCTATLMHVCNRGFIAREDQLARQIEKDVLAAKGMAAANGTAWDDNAEQGIRRNSRNFYETLIALPVGFINLFGLYFLQKGVRKLITGLRTTDAQEKLKKATAIELFLRKNTA